jgi:hypothetical protein
MNERTQSPGTLDAPPIKPTPSAAETAVRRLVRLHNLMLFVVFAVGLLSFAILQIRRSGLDDGPLRTALLILRIALPAVALLLTAAYTHAAGRRIDPALGSPRRDERIVSLFAQTKTLSILLLTLCGVFANACLLFGNRLIDLILALGTLGLLWVTRPSLSGLASFTALVDRGSEPDEPPSD